MRKANLRKKIKAKIKKNNALKQSNEARKKLGKLPKLRKK